MKRFRCLSILLALVLGLCLALTACGGQDGGNENDSGSGSGNSEQTPSGGSGSGSTTEQGSGSGSGSGSTTEQGSGSGSGSGSTTEQGADNGSGSGSTTPSEDKTDGGTETPENPDEETTTPEPTITEPTPTERQTIYLWDDDKIPAWRGNLNSNDSADFRPHILTYPAQGEIKGAVLICPGGAFAFKSMQPEGYNVAERLSALGYQCFIVSYRLSPYSQAESALDLARAVRYVRYHAKAYGIEEKDIAIVGFSAGGILCGEHALNWKGTVSPTLLDSSYVPDMIDGVNADVAAVGHIYSFYGRLSVSNNDVATLKAGNLPPTFYAYGTEDPFYSQFNQNVAAVKEAGVKVESHVYQGQPHGFGAGNENSNWIPDFDKFLSAIFEEN